MDRYFSFVIKICLFFCLRSQRKLINDVMYFAFVTKLLFKKNDVCEVTRGVF